MPVEFDIRPMVEKYSAMPVGRLRVLRSFEDLQLSLIRRGIVFVFAAWSGPAIMALQRFTKVLKTMDTDSLDLVVLDTDSLAEDLAIQLFGNEGFTTGGWGETIWVRDGRVVARELAHTASEGLIEHHTKGLLQDNAA
jgi:hypothetical protein